VAPLPHATVSIFRSSIQWLSFKPPVRAPKPKRQPPTGVHPGIATSMSAMLSFVELFCTTDKRPAAVTVTTTSTKLLSRACAACGGDARVVPSDFDAVGERVANLRVRIEADTQPEPAVSLLGRTAERRVGNVSEVEAQAVRARNRRR
jgi:hypothetical protein